MRTMVPGNPLPGEDPLTWALRPPSKETPAERVARLKLEQQALKRSEEIDRKLREDAQRRKKERENEQLLLLLGQAGAGKTTILKQFRLLYDPNRYERDLEAWQPIIYLNLITAVRQLLEAVEEAQMAASVAARESPPIGSSDSPRPDDARMSSSPPSTSDFRSLQQEAWTQSMTPDSSSRRGAVERAVLLTRLKLAPLLSMEQPLRQRLGALGEADYVSPGEASQQRFLGSLPSSQSGNGRMNVVANGLGTLLLRSGWQERLMRPRKSWSSLRERTSFSSLRSASGLVAPAQPDVDALHDASGMAALEPGVGGGRGAQQEDVVGSEAQTGEETASKESSPGGPKTKGRLRTYSFTRSKLLRPSKSGGSASASTSSPPSAWTMGGRFPARPATTEDMSTGTQTSSDVTGLGPRPLRAASSPSATNATTRLTASSSEGGLDSRRIKDSLDDPLTDATELQRANEVRYDEAEHPDLLLSAFREDIRSLWRMPISQRLRKKGRLDSADTTAYFLEHLDRISQPGYVPTNEDVLHARVRTVGITEERFKVAKNAYYRLCDVGGSRTQRAVWASYFQEARAIIFLAPLSAFDQRLVEDPRVNRMQDSLDLYADICANKLLSDVSLIVFMNKMDLLERKLAAGTSVKRYFPDYEGAEGDFEQAWRFFRQKFRAINKATSSKAAQRPSYFHTVVATSTRQVRAILNSVNDTILREHLKATGFT